MIYTDVSGRHGTAIKIQLTALDPGITVEAAEQPMHVTISSLRPGNESYCTLHVASYFALATSVRRMFSAISTNPSRPAYADTVTSILRGRPQDGGYIELTGEKKRRLLLIDSEFLSIGDNPAYVISALQQATGLTTCS